MPSTIDLSNYLSIARSLNRKGKCGEHERPLQLIYQTIYQSLDIARTANRSDIIDANPLGKKVSRNNGRSAS